MKFSEVTVRELADYLREDPGAPLLADILAAGKRYALDFTGLTPEEAEGHEDLSIAVLAVCADLYDKRGAALEGRFLENPLVAQILGAHSVNLLGGGSLD